jgi:hypothetical protein
LDARTRDRYSAVTDFSRNRRWLIAWALLAASACGVLAYLCRDTGVTRVRNSLLFEIADEASFEWTPRNAPPGFRWEHVQRGAPWVEIAGRALGAERLDSHSYLQGVAIARHLASGGGRGGAIQQDTLAAYRRIVGSGAGYCADYTQVFNALSYLTDLPVREWGLTFDGYGGHGHAFSEVFDTRLDSWVMIDSFNSFYPVDRHSGRPLSVLEFRRRLLLEHPLEKIQIVRIDPKVFGFSSDDALVRYYRAGSDQFFLKLGNDVLSYDETPLIKYLRGVSRGLEQAAAIALGRQPRLLMMRTRGNADLLAALQHLRTATLALGALALVSALGALISAYRTLRIRPGTLAVAA